MRAGTKQFDDAWLDGKRVVVMGLGRFGGGVGVARFLASRGAQVLVTDLDGPDRLGDSLSSLRDLIDAGAITLRLGGHDAADFASASLVVANPAVPKPWANAYLNAARAAGVPITTEISLLVERLPDRTRVLGVTGTTGKSTTSAMAAAVLASAFGSEKIHFGGNIGGSLLDRVHAIAPDHWVVLELSSAQLHWLDADAGYAGQPGWSPGVAALTNLAPNHLDWHRDFADYARAKRTLFAHQRAGDSAFLPATIGDPWQTLNTPAARHHADEWRSRVGEHLDLRLPGAHNQQNAAMAIAAAHLLAGVDLAAASRALRDFTGLPHRMAAVDTGERGRARGVRAFNDSKCTTPEGAVLAIAAFETPGECGAGKVVLIAGGADKGVSLEPMAVAAARCHATLTIGATGPSLAAQIKAAGGNAEHAGTLDVAISMAAERVPDGGVVLLSPGCASWDQFVNYQARGDMFAALIGPALSAHAAR